MLGLIIYRVGTKALLFSAHSAINNRTHCSLETYNLDYIIEVVRKSKLRDAVLRNDISVPYRIRIVWVAKLQGLPI